MIDAVDDRLVAWAEAAGATSVVLGPPSEPGGGPGVVANIYLLDLLHSAPPRTSTTTPLQFVARYLVTVSAPSDRGAHGLLGQLAFAALEATDMEVEFEPVPAAAWAAMGTRPQPSFLLRVIVRRPRPTTGPIVREPLIVHTTGLRSIRGRVFGFGDKPLVGATVAAPALARSATSGAGGRFVLPSMPVDQDVNLEFAFHRWRSEVAVPPNSTDPVDVHLGRKEN